MRRFNPRALWDRITVPAQALVQTSITCDLTLNAFRIHARFEWATGFDLSAETTRLTKLADQVGRPAELVLAFRFAKELATSPAWTTFLGPSRVVACTSPADATTKDVTVPEWILLNVESWAFGPQGGSILFSTQA